MTPTLAVSLAFVAHLVVFLVAVAAALALAREPGGGLRRIPGAVGFLVLAGAAVALGAGLAPHGSAELAWIRTAGFALLLVAAILPRPAPGPAAVVAAPAATMSSAVSAVLAGVAMTIRRWREGGSRWLGPGLLLWGAAEAVAFVDADWAGPAAHVLEIGGSLLVAAAVVALARQSIRFRFLVGFATVLVAVVLLVSLAIGTVMGRNLRDSALDRLLGQARDAVASLDDRAAQPIRLLSTLGEGGALATAVDEGIVIDGEEMGELRDRLFPDVDFLLLLNRDGVVMGRTGLSPGEALNVVGTEAISSAIEGDQFVSSLDATTGGGLVLVGAAPLLAPGEQEPFGFAVAGYRLDDDLLQREVIGGRGTRAAAYLGFLGRPPIMVSSAGFPRNEEPGTAAPQVVAEAFRSFSTREGAVRTALPLGEVDHFAAVAPLRQAGNRAVGALVVAEPAAVLAETQRDVNRVLFLVTVGVIGLAFLLALVAARRITRPLVGLTDAARRVQAGDLRAKAPVQGEDEVADLAVAFNQMTDSVGTMTGELRLSAEEQSRLRARLETVVYSMGDGLIAVDADDRVVMFNPAAASIVGVTRDESVGRPIGEVLSGRDEAGETLTRQPAEGLIFIRRRDGGEVPTALSSAPLRGMEDEAAGRVFVLRDMTTEYEVERMKREFLANVSHELRTPLTPIIGYSELMTRRELSGDQTRTFSESILEAGRRLERIVAMLVDFSALEAGRLPPVTEPLDVKPAIQDTVAAWQERTDRHRLETDVGAGLPPAEVDGALFRRMLDELLDNAVKYSPQGGRILVGAGSENGGPRRMLRVHVSDEGIGIDQGDLARVFQDFRQVDASSTRSFGGLGLGLAFVKRVAEAHGGGVTVRSESSGGSTFTFTIPAADTGIEEGGA
jgi:PAS domain S-box-containing protein